MTAIGWRPVFVLAVAVQCAVLYWPRTPSVESGLPLDKAVHAAIFAGVAAAGVLARIPYGWLVAGLAVQAVASEFIQGALLPGRGADPWDAAADVVGIALGLGAGVALRRTGD